jgi:hypothetical protein
MISLFLSNLWKSRKVRIAVAVLAVAVTGVGVYKIGHARGATQAHQEDKARAEIAVSTFNLKYREQEIVNERRIADIRTTYAKTEATAKVVDSEVVRNLDVGTQRMRFKVARCSPSPSASGPTPIRVDDPPTAELPGPIAAALYSIAADGDRAIRQLTALQLWAKAAVQLCNRGVK